MVAECINRLMIPESHRSLLLKAGPTAPYDGDQRRFVRRYSPSKAVLERQQSLPALPRNHERHAIIVIDLCRGGAGFFHSEQLFPGERATLTLKDKPLQVEIAWCQKLAEQCYQIGAKFVGGEQDVAATN